jgi:hypothetical protein
MGAVATTEVVPAGGVVDAALTWRRTSPEGAGTLAEETDGVTASSKSAIC